MVQVHQKYSDIYEKINVKVGTSKTQQAKLKWRNSNMISYHLFYYIILSTMIKEFYTVEIICRDPSIGQQVENENRKYALLSGPSIGGGLGNELIFYPAAYIFAAMTGRSIIVSDGGLMAELCSVITCGFPLLSEIAPAFPIDLSPYKIKAARGIKSWDFVKHFEGSIPEIDTKIVRPGGYMWKSNWWLNVPGAADCLSKITGCEVYDVKCIERHSFQALVRGPFRSQISSSEEKRISGIPAKVRHALLTLPHNFAPRLDIAVHLRVMFQTFEAWHGDLNKEQYFKEVQEFLNSTHRKQVFNDLENRILQSIPKLSAGYDGPNENLTYVYVAADDAYVKDAFIRMIEHKYPNIKAMRIESNSIAHTKNLGRMKNLTNNEGVFDMVFDWYTLSLSNVVLAWRRNTNMLSTYIATAVKVSGERGRKNLSESKYDETLGVGSRGMQLHYDKNGKALWSSF